MCPDASVYGSLIGPGLVSVGVATASETVRVLRWVERRGVAFVFGVAVGRAGSVDLCFSTIGLCLVDLPRTLDQFQRLQMSGWEQGEGARKPTLLIPLGVCPQGLSQVRIVAVVEGYANRAETGDHAAIDARSNCSYVLACYLVAMGHAARFQRRKAGGF